MSDSRILGCHPVLQIKGEKRKKVSSINFYVYADSFVEAWGQVKAKALAFYGETAHKIVLVGGTGDKISHGYLINFVGYTVNPEDDVKHYPGPQLDQTPETIPLKVAPTSSPNLGLVDREYEELSVSESNMTPKGWADWTRR